jgi:hypothetical protein
MMRHPALARFAAALGLALLPAVVNAQGGPPVNVTVTPTEVLFPTPTVASFEAGWVDHGGVTVTVSPRNQNRPNWQLNISASAADMGGYGKPVQDLMFRVQGTSTWVPLNTVDQPVLQGSGNSTITVFFRVRLDWYSDVPGTYSVPFEFSGRSL